MLISPFELLTVALTTESCFICGCAYGPLCKDCFETMSSDQVSRCYMCNKLTKQNRVCPSCTSSLRRVWWAGPYIDAFKPLVTSMKLGRNRQVARALGTYLAELAPYLPEDTLVVPIPTAPTRVRRRGFDQSVILARHFAEARQLSYGPVLRRISTVDQIGKRRSDRIAQMKHSFELKGNSAGKNVLLVDDVLTTGATLESAARLLRSAGAAHVDAVVIARHLPK